MRDETLIVFGLNGLVKDLVGEVDQPLRLLPLHVGPLPVVPSQLSQCTFALHASLIRAAVLLGLVVIQVLLVVDVRHAIDIDLVETLEREGSATDPRVQRIHEDHPTGANSNAHQDNEDHRLLISDVLVHDERADELKEGGKAEDLQRLGRRHEPGEPRRLGFTLARVAARRERPHEDAGPEPVEREEDVGRTS